MKNSYSIRTLTLLTVLVALGMWAWQLAQRNARTFHFHNQTNGTITELEVSIDSLDLRPNSHSQYGYSQINPDELIKIEHGLEYASISLSYSFNGQIFTYSNVDDSRQSSVLFQTEASGKWTNANNNREP